MNYVKLDGLKYLVLDEADRKSLIWTSKTTLCVLSLAQSKDRTYFSLQPCHFRIRELARTILKDPVEINIAISKPPEKIVQLCLCCLRTSESPLIKEILQQKNLEAYLYFVLKAKCKTTCQGIKTCCITGRRNSFDLLQDQREKFYSTLKWEAKNIGGNKIFLSRGIDIETLTLLLITMYLDGEDYVHRMG